MSQQRKDSKSDKDINSDNDLKELCDFFDKYSDNGGQYIDEEYIAYNGKLPVVYVKGVWPDKFGEKIHCPRGTYIGRKIR